ncbi:putative bifunctional diguanylate cyclase/phosphodiesterase [Actinoplanes sp. NPDC020271]|uniref:putative bifunctional diguanylate cyclase/phosphodiesterase n=1 Tax=Actinoplanes sp. NPDC020271 TaxID=3363896 RepID=UPI0037984FD6
MGVGARLRAALSLLLWPAAQLIGRLRYAQKFLLVGLVLLVPLVVTVNQYVHVQREKIDATVREQEGLRYLRTLLVMSGDLVQARRSAVSEGFDLSVNLDADVARVDEVDHQTHGAWEVHAEWARTREAIVAALKASDQAKSVQFQEYQAASDSTLALIVTIGDRSGLIHDPDLDSNYIARMLQDWLPSLCDVAGRIADLLEVTVQEQTGDQLTTFMELGQYFGIVTTSSDHLTRAADAVAASAGDDEAVASIRGQSRELKAVTAAMGERLAFAVEHKSLEQFPSHSADAVRVATNNYASVAVTTLDRLLQTRIGQSTARIREVRLWLGLASLLAVYLFAGFYFSVATPVGRIVEALRAVAGGDLSARVQVSTQDELSYIAKALNETITTTEVATGRLARLASRDTLTNLPNRAAVLDRLEQALLRVRHRSDLMAVLFIDLDRFKLVNDSLGHDAGDAVLRAVAERLIRGLRATDTVARLAGDEFVVISEEVPEVGAAVAAAERVVAGISEPIRVEIKGGHRDITIGASIGIAFVAAGNPVTADELLRDADVAMYQAKQRGRGRVEIFDERLSSALERRVRTEQDLRRAIHDDELVVFYQPIVEAGSGRTAGFEALVRWQHPTRGLVSPDEFIPVAEESGLIVALGASVLAQACRQLAEWQAGRADGELLRMSVNVSALQFEHPTFVETVAGVLNSTGIDPAALWLEITESALAADIAQVTKAFEALRDLGVRLALDDFGTGYSSLAHLRRFPVQALKIDRSFVDGLGRDPEATSIVQMIIGVAQTLGLLVIAEGVENAGQAEELERLGCRLFQGYYFGRPAPADMHRLTAISPAS